MDLWIAGPPRPGRAGWEVGGDEWSTRLPPDMTAIRRRPDTLLHGVLLAAVGGFLDAFTFIGYRVFANAQTGNVVLFGIEVAQTQWRQAFLHLAPVVAFMVGVLLVELLGKPGAHRRLRRPLRVALAVEIVGISLVAALPNRTPELVITVTVSLVAAIQFSTFRTLVDAPYTTLLTSGNLRTLVVTLYRRVADHNRAAGRQAARFGAVVAAFAAGAVIGAISTIHLGNRAAAIVAGLLLATLVSLIVETRRLERAAP
jgi:uncharacterized membrane protein YoaK (UPF0700 family)